MNDFIKIKKLVYHINNFVKKVDLMNDKEKYSRREKFVINFRLIPS